MSKINIILLDKLNNTKEETNMIKPVTYQQLLEQLRKQFKNLPKYFMVFILDKDNKELIINNEEKHKLIKDILFIREIDENKLEQSLFSLNYDMLSESQQEILDEKYNCIVCSYIVRHEKPYLCYKCQKIIHEKCLKDWDNKCKSLNQKLSCPNCRNELPIEKWNKQLDYEDNRIDNANMMNKINEYRLKINMINNINKIKDKKINEPKEINQNDIVKKYEQNIETMINIFNNVLNKINSIHNLLRLKKNDKLNNLINTKFNLNNLDLENISKVINEELEQFKNYIIKNNRKEQMPNKKEDISSNKNKILIDNNPDNKFNNNEKLNNNLKDIIKKFENNNYKNKINLIYSVKSNAVYNIFGNEFVENNKDNIELIINGKQSKLVSVYELMPGENNITLIIKNNLINLSYMFYWCNSLKSIHELKNLDVSQTKYFEEMFYGCSSINDITSLKNWNVLNSESFAGMFYKCSLLSDISPLKNWNVSNYKNLASMFCGCSLLSNINPLKNWNVSNCSNFDYMFSGCSLLSDISPLKNWNVSNGINFSYMFDNCSSLSNIKPLSNWNVSKCINFEYMFRECLSLSDITPLRNWNVSNCYNFDRMFLGCNLVLDLTPLDNWNIPKEKLKKIK